jgi:heavy metal translocating P-type ATPase
MRRTPLESSTDRWLALFVPLMVLLSVATGAVVWVVGESLEQAFVRALTVMVIACPCALGIAVPLARTAGLSKAARKGILVRESEAFERATRIEDIVFDKTGTLTQGCWLLESCKSGGPWSKDQVLALAAGLEKNVDHTIARVIRTHVRDQGLEAASLTDIRVEPGGVRGNFQGELWRIGSRDYALGQGDNQDSGDDFEELRSTVYLSRDGALAAVFHFGDSLREGSPALIRQLEKAGYTLHLVSGDSDHTTRRVARHLGLANAQGGLMPQAKSTLIETLQARGRRVAMVGDGINDAPALARADLSVAVHRDASLARQAAAVTLMRGDPAQLLDFFALAQQVNATVSRNLAWAWVYNLVGVPIAMSGLLNPLISVTAMLLSSLTVIGNTLLLVRRK